MEQHIPRKTASSSMRENLSAKDFLVEPDIRRAESLPASAFTDGEFLELELRTIFAKTWLLVPEQDISGKDPTSFTGFLKSSGSRSPFTLLGKPFFLQRGQRAQLYCFPNVCTHAWHPLVNSPTTGGAIVCPQHGRQFDVEGRFLSQTGFGSLENFPRESDHLRTLQVAEWGPFIFTALDHPLAPFHEFVQSVQQSIPGINLSNLRRHRLDAEVRIVEGNWKQHVWNYMDNYHIRFVHKGPGGLADAIDQSTYKTELYKYSSLQWVYAHNPEYGFDPRLLAPRFQDPKNLDRRVFALWWFVFPNLTLNFYPWGLSVNIYSPIPGQPDNTQFHWYQYAINEEMFHQRNKTWLSEQVDDEDIEAISLVSKGARSGYAPRGRFAPEEEAGPHWFHRLAYETIFEDQTTPR
ncbi:Rieske 2Fe-2S domain-containing protein [Candidatus Bathyarchaeota archaeon]|nr:MAG: Rieske 2Fe-2S domain-containing protein [Candidatus Bathyarchaeota archaeon]